jgi:hypothetical protein
MIGALENRYGDRHLAVGHRRQPKKRTQGDSGSQQKLVPARGRLTRRAIPAPRKGHGRQGPGKDISCAEPIKDGRSRRDAERHKYSNVIKDQGARRQLHLKERTTGSGIRRRIRRQKLCLGNVKILRPSDKLKFEVVK